MNAPNAVAGAIMGIVADSLLRIRAFAQQGECERCMIEADHVHNLPALMTNFSDALLRFYYFTERASYIRGGRAHDFEMFEPHWAVIESYLNSTQDAADEGRVR